MNNPLLNRKLYIPCVILAIVVFLLLFFSIAKAEDNWKITAYCSCFHCCGKTDGITASGKSAKYGYIACNWLPFGTMVNIEGLGKFKVMDRGAKSLFGSKKNHIKHLDVWLPEHNQARKFGVKYLKVEILKG